MRPVSIESILLLSSYMFLRKFWYLLNRVWQLCWSRKEKQHQTERHLVIDLDCVKSIRIRSFSGPYFTAFGLNMERYEVALRIQSECRKIRTRKNSEYRHFSCSAGLHNCCIISFNYDISLCYCIRAAVTVAFLANLSVL